MTDTYFIAFLLHLLTLTFALELKQMLDIKLPGWRHNMLRKYL